MDIAHIRRLIKLIQGTDITEIEIGEGEQKVRISRQSQFSVAPMAAPMQTLTPQLMAAPSINVAAPEETSSNNEHNFEAPMVGTFYRSPSPDASAFVGIGSKVKKGDVICIIEAMKLMNEIEAEYDGTIEAILVENATPIEFAQALFIITPA